MCVLSTHTLPRKWQRHYCVLGGGGGGILTFKFLFLFQPKAHIFVLKSEYNTSRQAKLLPGRKHFLFGLRIDVLMSQVRV